MGGAGAVVAEGQEARPPADVGPATTDRRYTVRVRTGVPWRDMRAEYGPWGRVYDLLRRWHGTATDGEGEPSDERHRAVATRYENLAVRYEATVLVAAISEWL